MKEYAVYKGDHLVCLGTTKEYAEFMGINEQSLKFYLTPSYQRRLRKRKNIKECTIVIEVEEDKDTCLTESY